MLLKNGLLETEIKEQSIDQIQYLIQIKTYTDVKDANAIDYLIPFAVNIILSEFRGDISQEQSCVGIVKASVKIWLN